MRTKKDYIYKLEYVIKGEVFAKTGEVQAYDRVEAHSKAVDELYYHIINHVKSTLTVSEK